VIVIHRGRILLDGPIESLRKNQLRTKRVTLLSEAANLDLSGPGVRVIERRPYQLTLEIELERVPLGALVDKALRQGTLRDLTVEDPPLEEIIRVLYERAERNAEP
jgi:ABC-2 type transport system ATP-binding protein